MTSDTLKSRLKILDDAVELFEAGMESAAFLRFIASGQSDLMAWAAVNEPDYLHQALRDRLAFGNAASS